MASKASEGVFRVASPYEPAGDQPKAIAGLVDGIQSGLAHQTLLGVTGSGKTFTMANVVQAVQRPTIIMAHNKTLAAQLYGEFKEFFPDNAVEYFVSYYDYYQPEAYVPSSDTFIEKDASINEHIEQMRLSATKALLERPDAIIVATVSSIYGLGDPQSYLKMMLHLDRGDQIDQRSILRRLAELQYTRNDMEFHRANYRVRGDVIDVFPAESEKEAIRIELFDDEVENLSYFDPLTGEVLRRVPRVTIYPKSHYVTPREKVLDAIEQIKVELEERLKQLRDNNRLVEAQRLEERTRYDIEMMLELGYCNGIENYSRYLSGREPGAPPPTLPDRQRAADQPGAVGRCPVREPRDRQAEHGVEQREGETGHQTDLRIAQPQFEPDRFGKDIDDLPVDEIEDIDDQQDPQGNPDRSAGLPCCRSRHSKLSRSAGMPVTFSQAL